ncbi:hypothetical protein [Isoptericola aurantiacus]|uniref:hypothetical protein n=1 Tax=Isoptericola aurantiacus TaxID=3377839 RepID=UPI00383ABC18
MDTSPAGLAALALVVLWLGYWVPQQVRRRQLLADARVADRFSGGLRVLAVADGAGKGRAMRQTSTSGAPATGSVPLVTSRTGGAPSGMTPQVRASRLAVLERRAARARRRLTLTVVLVLLTAAAWTVVGLGYVTWPVAAVPSALLAVVLALGRLAVMAARRSDARWRAERRAERQQATQQRTLAHGGPYAPRNRARVTGRAVHPSDTSTQMIPRVRPAAPERSGTTEGATAGREPGTPAGVASPGGEAAGDAAAGDGRDDAEPERAEPASAPAREDRPVGGEPWDPVPVPLPTYVHKASAPRPEQPTTVPTQERRVVPPPSERPVTPETAPASGGSERPDAGAAPEGTSGAADGPRGRDVGDEPRPRTETLGLPLEQILARRRAAG